MYLFIELTVILTPFLIWYFITEYYLNNYVKGVTVDTLGSEPIDPQRTKAPSIPQSALENTEVERYYLVTGGSGFIGSWIARSLLLRKEKNVILLDIKPKPLPDLIRHGAKYIQVDLADNEGLIDALQELKNELSSLSSPYRIIVYHTAAVVKHYQSWGFQAKTSAANIEMAKNLVSWVSGSNTFAADDNAISSPILITVGDPMAERRSIKWSHVWNHANWIQAASLDSEALAHVSRPRNKYISNYAWSISEAEKFILKSSSPHILTGSIRPYGYVTGYFGDPTFSRALTYGGGLLHSWGVPMSLVHVEDVVEACLTLENKLLDSILCREISGNAFSIGHLESTTLQHVYSRITKQMPNFRSMKVNAGITLVVGHAVNLYALLRHDSSNWADQKRQALLSGSISTLSLARFNTIQTAQLPNPKNFQTTQKVLGFSCRWSISQTIDLLVQDQTRIMEQFRDGKKEN